MAAPSVESHFHAKDDMTPEQYTLSRIMGTIIAVSFVIALFIMMFHLYRRCLRNSSSTTSLFGLGHYHHHHASMAPSIWSQRHSHVGTSGQLEKATIAQLPTFIYRAQETTEKTPEMGEKNEALLDCAICLSEFRNNEKGRLLPSCKHAFHIECIDMWFCSHSTCPLCRTDVVPLEGDEHFPQIPMEATEDSQQQNNGPNMVAQNEPGLHVSQFHVIDIFNCNQARVVAVSSSAEDSSCSHSASISSSSSGRLTHSSKDISLCQGNVSRGLAPTVDLEACSSHPMRNLSFRLSFNRRLSRELSGRQKNSNLEGSEEFQKH